MNEIYDKRCNISIQIATKNSTNHIDHITLKLSNTKAIFYRENKTNMEG